jgi:hypothetical protein
MLSLPDDHSLTSRSRDCSACNELSYTLLRGGASAVPIVIYLASLAIKLGVAVDITLDIVNAFPR